MDGGSPKDRDGHPKKKSFLYSLRVPPWPWLLYLWRGPTPIIHTFREATAGAMLFENVSGRAKVEVQALSHGLVAAAEATSLVLVQGS